MYCPNCGSQIPDGAVFCSHCGAQLGESRAQQNETQYQQPVDSWQANQMADQMVDLSGGYPDYSNQNYQQPGYVPPYQPQRPYYGLNPVQRAIKDSAGSGSFLTATICYTISLLLTLVSAFSGLRVTAMYAGSSAAAVSVVVALLGALPAILLTIGMWMVWGSGKNEQPTISGTGLIRGICILMVVLIAICILVEVIAGIYLLYQTNRAMSYASYYGYSSGAAGSVAVLVIVLILGVAVTVLMMTYYIKAAGLAKTARESVEQGYQTAEITSFVSVINVIVVVFSIISLIVTLIAGGAAYSMLYQAMNSLGVDYSYLASFLNRGGILSTIGSICNIITLIAITAAISGAKKRLLAANQQMGYIR